MLNALFKKQNRVLALVYADGTVEVIDNKNSKNHPAMDFAESDYSITGLKGDVQVKTVNIYEDTCVVPDQTLYSVRFADDKRPYMDKSLPKSVYNVIWNFLEGDVNTKKVKLTA